MIYRTCRRWAAGESLRDGQPLRERISLKNLAGGDHVIASLDFTNLYDQKADWLNGQGAPSTASCRVPCRPGRVRRQDPQGLSAEFLRVVHFGDYGGHCLERSAWEYSSSARPGCTFPG